MTDTKQEVDFKLIENTLCLFSGRCGHQWVGALGGYYGCPLCGDYNGDSPLGDFIAVQPEDLGCAWGALSKLSDKILAAIKRRLSSPATPKLLSNCNWNIIK